MLQLTKDQINDANSVIGELIQANVEEYIMDNPNRIISLRAYNKEQKRWVYWELSKGVGGRTLENQISGTDLDFLSCDPESVEIVQCKLEQKMDGL